MLALSHVFCVACYFASSALLHPVQQRFFCQLLRKLQPCMRLPARAAALVRPFNKKGECMTHLQALLTDPASFSARQREKILANVTRIITQPRHKLYKTAVQVHAVLRTAEQLPPPAQDLIRVHGLDWDRTGTRDRRFRGFADGMLVAVVLREAAASYRVELNDKLLPAVHRTLGAARAAASFAVATTPPDHRAA